MAYILQHPENLGNVLHSQDLTNFRTFVVSNYDSDENYNQKLPVNRQNVFDMAITRNCPNIKFCTKDSEENRPTKLSMPMFSHYRGKISKNGYFWEQKPNHMLCLEKEFKACDSFLYRRKFTFVRNLLLYEKNKNNS